MSLQRSVGRGSGDARRLLRSPIWNPSQPRPFSVAATRYQQWHMRGRPPRAGLNHIFAGSLIGGVIASIGWYAYYSLSDVEVAAQPSEQTKLDKGAQQFRFQFREITPGPTDEVIKALREIAEGYSAWIPGGKEFVDKSFKDLGKVRERNEVQVNEIVRDTYEELRDVTSSRKRTSLETVNAIWTILARRLDQLSSLSGDVAEKILDQHPELRAQLDSSFDCLRRLGDRLGPGARREVDDTFNAVSELIQRGVNPDTAEKVHSLVQQKAREIRARIERAWKNSWDQIQPLLERQPGIMEIVLANIEILKHGRAKEVVDKIRQAVLSGSTGELERYIRDLTRKSQQHSSGSLCAWLNRVPNGSPILPKLQKVKQAADAKSSEAERLARFTLDDISRYLDRRAEDIDRILKTTPGDAERSTAAWI